MDIFSLINLAGTRFASDLHLIADSPPLLRINGELSPLADMPPLTADDITQAFHQLTSDRERADFERCLELDFGYTIPHVCRLTPI